MSLVTGLEILSAARAGHYGVGAFNTNNMEITQAIVEAAEETRSPVIVALSEGGLKYGGAALMAVVRHLGESASVPVAVHLDHGSSYESCVRAIELGFTSVMIDMSHEDEATNVRETRRVVEAAHAAGVTVEAEIGRLGGIEEHVVVSADEATLTDPDEAERFMQSSGADYLAVAIGTSHGANKGKGRPYIDHERIAAIAARVPAPLVMHGASGVPAELVARFVAAGGELKDAVGIHEDDVRRAVTQGIAKINTDTDLRLAMTTAVREALNANPKEFDPRKVLGPARAEMKSVVAERMRVFGSAGQAA
ncbi:MAG: class II fructose-1,6-bisphosphate aldolase [Trueperaceae bacterium]